MCREANELSDMTCVSCCARLSAAIATSKFIGKINITKRVAGEAVISHKSASNKLAVHAVDTSARKQVVLTHCEVFKHTVC